MRGKYKSEGEYVMTRPLRGPLNNSKVDHSTDAYDTIDWLVKNVKESNGKVGMIGSSYEGFTVLMGLVNPHPALKVAVPMSPMVDGWKGDDWFHNGAFRQTNLDYIYMQNTERGEGKHVARENYDDYTNFLRYVSTGAYAQARRTRLRARPRASRPRRAGRRPPNRAASPRAGERARARDGRAEERGETTRIPTTTMPIRR